MTSTKRDSTFQALFLDLHLPRLLQVGDHLVERFRHVPKFVVPFDWNAIAEVSAPQSGGALAERGERSKDGPPHRHDHAESQDLHQNEEESDPEQEDKRNQVEGIGLEVSREPAQRGPESDPRPEKQSAAFPALAVPGGRRNDGGSDRTAGNHAGRPLSRPFGRERSVVTPGPEAGTKKDARLQEDRRLDLTLK